MPTAKVHDILEQELPIARRADRIVPAYNLTERLQSRMWETSKNIIDMKIGILENHIKELKGMKQRLDRIKY